MLVFTTGANSMKKLQAYFTQVYFTNQTLVFTIRTHLNSISTASTHVCSRPIPRRTHPTTQRPDHWLASQSTPGHPYIVAEKQTAREYAFIKCLMRRQRLANRKGRTLPRSLHDQWRGTARGLDPWVTHNPTTEISSYPLLLSGHIQAVGTSPPLLPRPEQRQQRNKYFTFFVNLHISF